MTDFLDFDMEIDPPEDRFEEDIWSIFGSEVQGALEDATDTLHFSD